MYIPHLLLLLRSSLFYHARVLPFAARARVPPKIFQTDAAAAPLSLSLSLLPFFPSSNSTEFHPVQHLREQRANARVCVYSRFPASLLRGVVICPGVLLKSQSDDFSRGSFRDGSTFFFVRVISWYSRVWDLASYRWLFWSVHMTILRIHGTLRE